MIVSKVLDERKMDMLVKSSQHVVSDLCFV